MRAPQGGRDLQHHQMTVEHFNYGVLLPQTPPWGRNEGAAESPQPDPTLLLIEPISIRRADGHPERSLRMHPHPPTNLAFHLGASQHLDFHTAPKMLLQLTRGGSSSGARGDSHDTQSDTIKVQKASLHHGPLLSLTQFLQTSRAAFNWLIPF